ncbi:MAG: hypothetical protein UHD64_10750 [Bacteroidales bacterium]|nr:hypothetical protein [Bacteroidales bacterium]
MCRRKNTEISLMDAISMIDNFCPIKIYYNGKVLWDDDGSMGVYMPLEAALENYKIKHPNWSQILIHSIKIDIDHFHHGIIRLKGRVVKHKDSIWDD